MLKDKLDGLEYVKLNLDFNINKLFIESNNEESINITEDQIRSCLESLKSLF